MSECWEKIAFFVFFGQNFEMEADKPQPNLQMQAMMDEMRPLMTNEFNQLHERMDRIEAQEQGNRSRASS